MKIAITGAHGTGKTTLVNKLKESGIDLKFVDSPTRSIKAEIRLLKPIDIQQAILNKHLENLSLKGNVVYDRCLLDLLVYSYSDYIHDNIAREDYNNILNICLQNIERYDKIYYIKPEFKVVGDEFRSDDEQFQTNIDDMFNKIINDYNINVTLIKGKVEEKSNIILKYLKENNVC